MTQLVEQKPYWLENLTEYLFSLYAELGKLLKDISVSDYLAFVVETLAQIAPESREAFTTAASYVQHLLEVTAYYYPDVPVALENLHTAGDQIIFWTQGDFEGQRSKLNNMGYVDQTIDESNCNLVHLDRHIACISKDKITSVVPLISELVAKQEGNQPPLILVIDDKLDTVAKMVTTAQQQGALACGAWMRRPDGSYRNTLPNGITEHELPAWLRAHHIAEVNSMHDFVALRHHFADQYSGAISIVMTLVDLDHTTFQTIQHRRDMAKLMAEKIQHVSLSLPQL